MKTKLLLTVIYFSTLLSFSQTPANNDCVNRESISVITANYNEYSIDTSTATESLDNSCEVPGYNNLDVWYEFTMPVNGNIQISNISFFEYAALFDTCGGAELGCFNNDGYFYNLTGGTTYILRISRRDVYSGTINFRIQAIQGNTNDDCSNREIISVITANYLEYNIDTSGASESIDSSCENASNDNLDVWYEFTMPVNGNIQISNISFFEYAALFDTCGGIELGCFNDRDFFYSLNAATTYILRLSNIETQAGSIAFRIQAFESAINDLCSNRESISVITANYNEYSANLGGATETLNTSCEDASNDNLDVFYEFTMPVNGDLIVTNISPNTVMTLGTACNGQFIGCFIDDDVFTNLTENTTYILRVSRSSQSIILNNITFRVQASSTLGITDVFNEANVLLYPNPTHEVLNIKTNLLIDTIEVIDVNGRKILNTNFEDMVNVSQLNNGLYFIKLNSGNKVLIKKFIIN